MEKHLSKERSYAATQMSWVSGIMPMKALMEYEITITLGTDGAQSNNSMDLLRDLRTGILLQKQINEDATFWGTRAALRMVTIEGAKALNMQNQIGSLEIGKKADIIALDNKSPRIVPFHKTSVKNLYATVTYGACGADVVDSMVDGKWVMRNKNVLTLNGEEVRRNAQEAAEYLVVHSGIEM